MRRKKKRYNNDKKGRIEVKRWRRVLGMQENKRL